MWLSVVSTIALEDFIANDFYYHLLIYIIYISLNLLIIRVKRKFCT
jgi:hypothetical protein